MNSSTASYPYSSAFENCLFNFLSPFFPLSEYEIRVGNFFAKILENVSNGKLKNISILDVPALIASIVHPSGRFLFRIIY
jgi:hypothetical protein